MKHTKKRVAALLLTLAMVLSLAPMAFAADEFPDMPAEDDPSYAAVKSAIDNQIMTGENGELKLEGTILRSTVAKMVVTAFAAKGEADLSGYPDVIDGAWYASWMAKANQMGIMTGTSGRMNPGNEVTLAEVAAMLVRALGLSVDKDAKLDGVADWAAPYVKALIDANYITAEAAADAGKPMTRGAFAEVIYKISGEGNYAKEENAEITKDVNGNIVITANGVSLKGITVTGDVIIADGVDAGTVTLDNVKVEGRVVVRGAGANLTNGTTAGSTVVAAASGETTVKADTTSDAGDIAVAGTNGKAADKVVLDMAEPKATVTAATEVAVQNANGGEVTLQAANASLSVESGTVGSVTVADGASGVKVDVASGATIDKVTTNSDLAVTGEGTVTEKAGSGTVTDGSGSEVAGSDEPANVPIVDAPQAPVEQLPTKPNHTHNWSENATPFDATRHAYTCVTKAPSAEGANDGITGCNAVKYEAHSWTTTTTGEGDDAVTETTCSVCGAKKPGNPTTSEVTVADGKTACKDGKHSWDKGEVQKYADGKNACTADTVVKYTCTVDTCGATYTVTTPATGHSYVQTGVVTAATCHSAGKMGFKCSRCGDTKGVPEGMDVIPATGDHNWVVDTENCVEANCVTAGVTAYKCSNDGCDATDTITGSIDPNKHSTLTYTWNSDTQTHTVKCTNEGENGEKCPVYGANGKTVSCNIVVKTKGTPATCGAAGTHDVLWCAECKNVYQEAGSIAKLEEHTPASAWTTDGTNHWHVCTVCGGVVGEKAEHTAVNGICSVCGAAVTPPCENAENHGELHKGEKCPNCNFVGNADHTWNKTTTCTRSSCGATHVHSYSGGSGSTHGTCSICTAECGGTVTNGACSNGCGATETE